MTIHVKTDFNIENDTVLKFKTVYSCFKLENFAV